VAQLQPPLSIVVLNNQGGRLFEQLPIARDEARDLSPWLTPHAFELYGIAAAYGLSAYRVDSRADLALSLERSRASGAPSLIEVIVNPKGAARVYGELVLRLRAALLAEPV
jgi:2-succinyl-5-enolpyruvyl-6-hydroxy-3-cyclohexene-1-carboxylate synthase